MFVIAFAPSNQAQPLIGIRGGNPLISITSGLAGGQPFPVINATTRLDYRPSAIVTKITVASSCPGQKFGLKVIPTGVTVGIPSPEVILNDGMPAADFITNIPIGPLRRARCTLQYTASASFDQGNSIELGNDVHLVTYTVVAQ